VLVAGCGEQTICATREAQEIEPRMNEIIALAVAYWADQGYTGLRATNGDDCDVPVRPVAVPEAMAATSLCEMDAIDFDPQKWPKAQRLGAEVKLIAHEIGHMYCFEDSADGVMSYEAHVDELDDYQLPEPATVTD
jgi:hypothetical protein